MVMSHGHRVVATRNALRVEQDHLLLQVCALSTRLLSASASVLVL